MSNLKIVNDDDEFSLLLKNAADDDLVVIDFFTTWCKPCRTMEPVFETMALHYPKALFLKVDADKCFNSAMSYKVAGVPFFVIYFNKTVVETIQGANPQELELKIRMAEIECRKASMVMQKSSSLPVALNPVLSTYGKLGTVAPYINADNSYCLNDLSPTSFHNFLSGKKLVSGRGTGKILLVYSFTQKMMLQSFKVKANPLSGPKVLRFFVNHPKVLDFNVGSALAPSQEVTLSHNDLSGDRAIELRSGSFQVVTNIQIFVTSGQTTNSRIEIDSLQLYGAPVLAVQPLTAVEAMSPHKAQLGISATSDSLNNSNPLVHSPLPLCTDSSCAIPRMESEQASTSKHESHHHHHGHQKHHHSHSTPNDQASHSKQTTSRDLQNNEKSESQEKSGHHHHHRDHDEQKNDNPDQSPEKESHHQHHHHFSKEKRGHRRQ